MELIIIGLILVLMVEVYVFTRTRKYRDVRQISMLVDTSVLMDGRVVDLAETGFLLGHVIVPKSVLAELQLLADGSDHVKRERARLGMDAVKKLKDLLGSSFTLLQDGAAPRGVDEALIRLAKETDSAILTLDYNLNKVAQVEGVRVLNINELAKSIRMLYLPGAVVTIALVQKGQGADQAVGYLDDGTMIVVEQAKKYVGQTKQVEIIRSLQTDAGKMMFAKLVPIPGNSGGTKNGSPKKPFGGNRRARQEQPNEVAQPKQSRPRQAAQKPAANRATRAHPHTNGTSTPRRGSKTTPAQHEAELIRLVQDQ